MAGSCVILNFKLSDLSSPRNAFNGLFDALKTLITEKKEQAGALLHWLDSHSDEIIDGIELDTTDAWGKRESQTARQRFFEIRLLILSEINDNSLESDFEEKNEVETEDSKLEEAEQEKIFFDKKLSKIEETIFSKNRILINNYRANFRSLIVLSLLYYKDGNTTKISYSQQNINKSLFDLRRSLYKTIATFLKQNGVTGLKPVYNRTYKLNSINRDNLLSTFENILKDNFGEMESTLLELWRNSNGDLHLDDDITLLDAVQAYLYVSRFDDLIQSEFGRIIKIDKNLEGVELSKTDDDDNIIEKYIFGKNKNIKESYGSEFYDALGQVGTLSKSIAESIVKKSIINGLSKGEKIKISDFGIAFNLLKNTIYKLPQRMLDDYATLKQLKQLISEYKNNPNEYISKILNIIHTFTSASLIRQHLQSYGCDLHVLDVLYSISDFVNQVTRIESNDIYGSNPVERTGIHSLLRLDILINLLTLISPANYLSTDLSYGNNKTSYISKNQSERNRQLNKIADLQYSMYRMNSTERKIKLNQRVDFVDFITSENKKIHSTTLMILTLKNRNNENIKLRLMSYNSNGMPTSLFENVANVTLLKDLDPDTEERYKIILENIGITNGSNIYSKNNRKYVQDYIKQIKDDQSTDNSTLISELENYLEDTKDLFDIIKNNTWSRKQLTLMQDTAYSEYDVYRSLLLFMGDMLNLPINTEQGIEILFKSMNDANGISLRHYMVAASRIALLHLSMSEYQESLDDPNVKYKDFDGYIRLNFNTSINSKFLQSFGGYKIPNPILTTEGWTKAWYNAEASVLGLSFPSTTKNADKNNIANFRESSLASTYRELFIEHAKDVNSASHDNLFTTFSLSIVDFAYDMQVVTKTGTKKTIKELNQSELIYHLMVHNFFNSFATTGLLQIQPTVYSDKTAFVLYSIDPKLISFKKEQTVKDITQLNNDEYLDLYASTVGKYYKKSWDGTINQLKLLYNYSKHNGNKDVTEKELNDWLNTLDTKSIEQLILDYNSKLDDLKFDIEYGLASIDGNKVRSNNKEEVRKCLEQNGFYSDERILLAINADYRKQKDKNGKEYLSLVEIGKYYSDLTIDGKPSDIMILHMKDSLHLMIYTLYKYNTKINTRGYDVFKLFLGNESLDNWVDDDLNLIFAKTKDGAAIKNLTLFRNSSDIIINPALQKYFWIENILSGNLKYGLLGDEVADPDKTSNVSVSRDINSIKRSDGQFKLFSKDQYENLLKLDMMLLKFEIENGQYQPNLLDVLSKVYNDNCKKIISSCEGALYKRNVIMPATMIPMSVDVINGLGRKTNFAIIDDKLALCFNTKGETKSIDSMDGSAWRTALQADLENASLGDNVVGYDLAKTIWHQYDKKTGKSFLAKWAVFTLSNARMNGSAGSALLSYKLYKQMTNRRWKGQFDLCNSRLINNGDDKSLMFARDILANCPGGLYYKDNKNNTYSITGFGILNGKKSEHRYYYTKEENAAGNTFYVITLFNEDSEEVKIRFDESILPSEQYEKIDKIVQENNLHTIDSNFELFVALGGINCVNSFDNDEVSENSHHAVTGFMNNVFSAVDENYEGLNLGHFILPLKLMQIGYAANKSAIKRYLANLNDVRAWSGDYKLNYIEVDNRFLGKQGDPDHEADDSEVSEMTLVIASLDVGGETHLFAKLAFEALGRLTANGMSANVEVLAKIINPKGDNTEIIASLIYHIIGEAFFKGFKSNNQFDIGTDIVNNIKKTFYVLGYNGHTLNSSIELFLPISDPNVFGALISSVSSQMNELALKRKYKGIGSVLVPGFDTILLYHFFNLNCGLTFLDVYKLGFKTPLIKKGADGTIIYKSKDSIYTVTTNQENNRIAKIDGSKDSLITKSNIDSKVNSLLTILSDSLTGDEIEVLNINLELLESVGLYKVHDDIYKYKPLTEYLRKLLIVNSYLITEQNKVEYTKTADLFSPTDRVNIYSNGELIHTIDLDELHKYYEFKLLFVTLNQTIQDLIIDETTLSKFVDLTGEGRINYVRNHFAELLKQLYPDAYNRVKKLNDSCVTYNDVKDALELAGNKDPFYDLFYFSLLENLTFQENILKPYNLRPQLINFKTKNGTYANIYDIDASVELYLRNTKYVQFKTILSTDSDSRLRLIISESTRVLSGETQGSISIYGQEQEIDPKSVEIHAAEAVMSNIYLSMFNQGNRSMYEQDNDFKHYKTKSLNLLYSDFSLCSTKNRVSFILGNINMNGVFGEKFRQYYVDEDYTETQNGDIDIYAIDHKTKLKLYKIGYFENVSSDIRVNDNGVFINKNTNTPLLNQENYVQKNNAVYKKHYIVKYFTRVVNNHKERFILFDLNELKTVGSDFISNTIRDIKINGKYLWLQLNGSLIKSGYDIDEQYLGDNGHILKIIDVLKDTKFNYKQEEAFDISVENSKNFLIKLKSDIENNVNKKEDTITDDTFVDIYKFYSSKKDSYASVMNNIQKARTNFLKASYELSKMIISARIPAQSLLSYMAMLVVGYLPTNTNLVIVSHFLTWLQGSDYDIDKSYIMAFLFSNNGVFESWSPLFDFSSKNTLKESLKLSMPKGIKLNFNEESGINIDSYLRDYNKYKEDEIMYISSKQLNEVDYARVLQMKILTLLIDYIEDHSINKATEIYYSEEVSLNLELILKIQEHENHQLSLTNLEAATKNFIASRIYNISSDPRNMWCAYTPILVDTLHKAANNANKDVELDLLLGSNPLTKAIMLFLNMDGKDVIGITAVGERVFMALSYYWNEGIKTQDPNRLKYMHFIHHTNRIKGRATGNPVDCYRNVKTDINWKLAENPLKLKDALIAWKGFKDKVTKEIKAKHPEYTDEMIARKVNEIVEENSNLWTLGDELISILLSAATDNAKELILSKINAGKLNADIYIHLLILGYDINDIVAFMISPSVKIATTLTAGNIFADESLRLLDLTKLINGQGFKFRDNVINTINEAWKSQDGVKELQNKTFKNSTDLTEYILSSTDTKSLNKLKLIINANYEIISYYYLNLINLLFEINQLLRDNNITYQDFKDDVNEYNNVNLQKGETKNLGTLCGLAKGVNPVLKDLIARITSIENIYNKAIRYFSYTHKNNAEFGLYIAREADGKDKNKEDDCINEIISRHQTWDEDTIRLYLRAARQEGLLIYSETEKMYQCKFDLNRFVEDANYRDVALHIYDFVKLQYNIFDVIVESPLYFLALKGWSIIDRIRTMSSIKGGILDLVKRNLQLQNAPFEDYEIGKTIDYANELLITNWLSDRIKRNKKITFTVPKGGLLYTDDMDIVKAEAETEVILLDNKSIRTFKLWIENYLIPLLLLNTENNITYIGDKLVITKPGNLFLLKLQYAHDQELIFRKLDFDMSGKTEGFHNSLEIQQLIDSFNELDLLNESLPIKITDYFMLYNLLINKNSPGRDRLTNLMHKQILNNNSMMNDYNDFVGREDLRLKQIRPTDLTSYLTLRFNYSFNDVKIKIAKTYKSNAKYHNGELLIFEKDRDGKLTIKEREKDYGKKSSYKLNTKSLVWQFLSKDIKKLNLRLRNLAEDGIFMNVSSEESKKFDTLLSSDNPNDVLSILAKVLRDRRMLINYNCV